jgi:molybdenum cofactor biosynthesis protein B
MATSVEEHRSKARRVVGCFVITVSDTRTEKDDESGGLIASLLEAEGHRLIRRKIVRDEPDEIRGLLDAGMKDPMVDAIILTGGTGISKRDQTYEAVQSFLEKRLDGFGELFRFLSYQEIGSAALLSRAAAGVAGGKAIFSLPGSRAAVRLAMEKLILPEIGHIVAQAERDP